MGYQAILGDGTVVGQGETASQALQVAQNKGYSASDVLIKQISSGELLST